MNIELHQPSTQISLPFFASMSNRFPPNEINHPREAIFVTDWDLNSCSVDSQFTADLPNDTPWVCSGSKIIIRIVTPNKEQ